MQASLTSLHEQTSLWECNSELITTKTLSSIIPATATTSATTTTHCHSKRQHLKSSKNKLIIHHLFIVQFGDGYERSWHPNISEASKVFFRCSFGVVQLRRCVVVSQVQTLKTNLVDILDRLIFTQVVGSLGKGFLSFFDEFWVWDSYGCKWRINSNDCVFIDISF